MSKQLPGTNLYRVNGADVWLQPDMVEALRKQGGNIPLIRSGEPISGFQDWLQLDSLLDATKTQTELDFVLRYAVEQCHLTQAEANEYREQRRIEEEYDRQANDQVTGILVGLGVKEE